MIAGLAACNVSCGLGRTTEQGAAAPSPPCVLAIAGVWQGDFGHGGPGVPGVPRPIDRTARGPCRYGRVVHFK